MIQIKDLICVSLVIFSLRLKTSYSQEARNPFIVLTVKEIIKNLNETTESLHNLLNKSADELRSNEAETLFSYLENLKYRSKFQKTLDSKMEGLKNDLARYQMYPQVYSVPTVLDQLLMKLFEYTLSVQNFFEEFTKLIKIPFGENDSRKKHFALKMTEPDANSLADILNKFHEIYFNENFRSHSLVELLSKNTKVFLTDNQILKSPHQLLFDFLKFFLYTEIQGYIMKKHSYKYLEKIGEANATYDVEILDRDFGVNIDSAIYIIKDLMDVASKEVNVIFSNQHTEGITYEELKFVFQLFIANEMDISPADACSKECSNYDNYKGVKSCQRTPGFCPQSKCIGNVYNCSAATTVIDCAHPWDTKCLASAGMKSLTVCPTKGYGQDSLIHRRFDHAFFNGSNMYGILQDECPVKVVKVESSYEMSARIPVANTCDNCACTCDENTNRSEKWFSLDPVMANIDDNFVVTGIRFVKANNIIFLQIQQGLLLSYGEIDMNYGVEWKSVSTNPQKKYQLDWETRREIELIDLRTPKGYVIIGVTFATEDREKDQQRLTIKAFAKKLDFHGGKLVQEILTIQNHDLTKYPVKIAKTDIPTRHSYTPQDTFISNHNEYVVFGISDFIEDFGQSTVPFIDITNVATDPPVPMSGVGLYHTHTSNDAGFLRLKLFTYDYDIHLNADFYSTS